MARAAAGASRGGKRTSAATPNAARTGAGTGPGTDTEAGSGMTPGRALRARGRETRARLLDAGSRVFAAKGYHATRVDDIVKVARTSHGTFYLYFANKEALFDALVAEAGAALHDLAETLGPLRPGPEGRAAIGEWIARLATIYDAYGPVIRAASEVGSATSAATDGGVLAGFTSVVRSRVSEVAPDGIDPEIASSALVAMLDRMHDPSFTNSAGIDPDAVAGTLAHMMHVALFGTDPGRSPS